MAKIAQLIEAGDYLVYKGDWATNTAYNVNDVVTWTDGQLYEVIKAHTSSDTLKPGNTEYYKAMTAEKSLRYLGVWNNSTTYHKNDVVTKDTGIFIALKNSTGTDPTFNTESWKPAPSLIPQSISYTTTSTTGTAYRTVLQKIKEIIMNYSSSEPNRGYNGELLIVAKVEGVTRTFTITDYNGDISVTALCITARTGNLPTLYVIHLTNDAGGKAWKLDFSNSPLSLTEIGAPTNVGLTFTLINF